MESQVLAELEDTGRDEAALRTAIARNVEMALLNMAQDLRLASLTHWRRKKTALGAPIALTQLGDQSLHLQLPGSVSGLPGVFVDHSLLQDVETLASRH